MENNRLQQLFALLETNPTDDFLRYALALEHVKLNQDADAVLAFEALRAQHPAYLPLYYHFGLLLGRLGRPQEAGAILKQGAEVARAQKNNKTLSEIIFAYEDITGEDMEDEG